MRDDLVLAVVLARTNHQGQKDKSGFPYVNHPLRVMANMNTKEGMIVAILHDIIEDTDITIELIEKLKFSDNVIYALDAISRRPGEKLKPYLRRIKQNPLALRVKEKDIEDNLQPWRLDSLTEKERERLAKKYKFCISFIQSEKVDG